MLDCKRGGKTGKTGAAHARSTSPFFDNFSRVNHSLKKKELFYFEMERENRRAGGSKTEFMFV